MKAIVIGCGRIGAELAYRLFKRGHEVSVVDNVAAAFSNLPADFQGRIHEGDALNQDVLVRAGIQTCDVLAAVTNNDALNMVVSHIARIEYNVGNIVARNYNPVAREYFEVFDIQVVGSTSWGAQRIEELMYHKDARTVFSAGNGEVEIYELTMTESWDGKTIGQLIPCESCKPIALTRGGRAVIPEDSTVIHQGDIVHIAATFDGIEKTRIRLDSMKKEA